MVSSCRARDSAFTLLDAGAHATLECDFPPPGLPPIKRAVLPPPLRRALSERDSQSFALVLPAEDPG
jgi:hypothetical protein